MPFGTTSADTPMRRSSPRMNLLGTVIAAADCNAGQSIFSQPFEPLAFQIRVSMSRRPHSRASASIPIATLAVCHSSAITSVRSSAAAAGATIHSSTNAGRLDSQSATFSSSPS